VAGKAFSTRVCNFYVGENLLFSVGLPYLPCEGVLVDYTDVETSVTTRYRVQDVVLEVTEVAAVPPDPPEPGYPVVHVPGWRIEIAVVP
jgi:hypothetical protein